MRLLNVHTFEFREFSQDVPTYVIASHRWEVGTEVSYREVREQRNTSENGFKKIEGFTEYVKRHIPHADWLWIDTCCIDRRSSREVTEAINSMYMWYQKADMCLAYLSDVEYRGDEKEFIGSEWFKRGWTLQELIAPDIVIFLSWDWRVIGHKGRYRGKGNSTSLRMGRCLERDVASISGIPEILLRYPYRLEQFSIEDKLAWMDGRTSLRAEDLSYCLLGICGVNISLSYGEGGERARRRLLDAIECMNSGKLVTRSTLTIPYPCNSHYSDRPELMEQMRAKLLAPGARAALVGVGGAGKSQLAIEYAYRSRGQFMRILWINATNTSRCEQSLHQLAIVAGRGKLRASHEPVAEKLDLVSRWLRDPSEGRWLIILDDLIDAEVLLTHPNKAIDQVGWRLIDCIPECDHGSVLITTRNLDVKKLVDPFGVIKVGEMDTNSAILLLEHQLNRQSNKKDMTELATAMDFSPFAMTKAAQYIHGEEISVQQFLEAFSEMPTLSRPSSASSVASIFSIEHIQEMRIWVRQFLEATRKKPALSRTSSASSMASIFSLASVASSVSSVGAAELSETTVRFFVNSLFVTPELISIHISAISEQAIGIEKYQRNLQRLISNCGKALKSEVGPGKSLTAARLLRSREFPARATRSIVERVEQQSTNQLDVRHIAQNDRWVGKSRLPQVDDDDEPHEDASDASSDDGEAELPEVDMDDTDEQAIVEYMRDSQAFLQFKAQLLEFAHLPYLKRIQRSLKMEHDDASYPRLELMMGIAHELSWIPPDLLHFDEREQISILDHLKAWAEDSTGEEWIWWPLRQCTRAIRAGDVRVKWQTPCGTPRSIDLPRSVARSLQETITTAPKFLSPDYGSEDGRRMHTATTTHVPGAYPHASSSAQPSNSQFQVSLPQQASSHQNQPSPPPRQTTSSIASGGQYSGTQLQIQSRKPHFVYLSVRKGGEWRVSKLKIHKYITDAKVFSALRRKYLTKKGVMARWLSCWQYSHCQFYQFSKYPYGAAPIVIDFPPDKYDFVKPVSPRPSPYAPFGPITQEEFRDRFYNFCEDCCHSWHRKQMLRWLPSLADEERIKVLPKRKEQLQWADSKAELFWGLKVCERISGRMVSAYIVLFNLPAVVFFFLWLFDWYRPSDLQNASVPFFASVTLTVGFMSWITRNRKGDVDE